MKYKRESPDPFSYSFIDLLSCAMGGMILILITTSGQGDAYDNVSDFAVLQISQPGGASTDHFAFIEVDDRLVGGRSNSFGINTGAETKHTKQYYRPDGLTQIQQAEDVILEASTWVEQDWIIETNKDLNDLQHRKELSEYLFDEYNLILTISEKEEIEEGLAFDYTGLTKPVRIVIGYFLCTNTDGSHPVQLRYQRSRSNRQDSDELSFWFDLSIAIEKERDWSRSGGLRVESPNPIAQDQQFSQKDVFNVITVDLRPGRRPVVFGFSDSH